MKLLRRRRVIDPCHPVFYIRKPVTRVRHSVSARECDGRRNERGCETWIDYLARYRPDDRRGATP